MLRGDFRYVSANGVAMNWKRGLFRLWVVATACWISFVLFVQNVLAMVSDPLGNWDRDKVAQLQAAGFSNSEISSHVLEITLTQFAKWAILPPTLLLLLGLGIWWSLRGFRGTQQ